MRAVVLVLGLGACNASTPAQPAVAAANSCPPPELSCKDAVEKAGLAAHLQGHDVTFAIGECEQLGWNVDARKCVAASRASADLITCSGKFSLGQHGIFAESMSPQKAIAEMTHFRDAMCACKDANCAQQVSDEMTRWGQAEQRSGREPPKFSDDDVKVFTQVGEDMGHCMMKAMSNTSAKP